MSNDTPRTDSAMRQMMCYASHPAVECLSELARTLERELSAARQALRIIASEEQCVDNLLSDKEVARAALSK